MKVKARHNPPRRGQRWRNKQSQIDYEITATQGERIKIKPAYGGGLCHTITKKDLNIHWEKL